MELQLSTHARTRMRQRGIPGQVLPFLMKFGKREYDHRGEKIVFITRCGRNKIRPTADKALLKRLEPDLDVYTVLNVREHVATIGHWTTPGTVGKSWPHNEARSNASGRTARSGEARVSFPDLLGGRSWLMWHRM
jgi:hypothetical protein